MPRVLLRCNDNPLPLEAVEAEPVLETLREITLGWRFEAWPEPWPAAHAAKPQTDAGADETIRDRIHVSRFENGYWITAPWRPEGYRERSAVNAACSLIVELNSDGVRRDPSKLCLHAAAVAFGDRAVVFPSTHGAGKSTFVAELARCGVRVLADDILPIALEAEEAKALALGVAPRLRWPPGKGLEPAFLEFADSHAGPHDHSLRYLSLDPSLLAAKDEAMRIGGFVFLDRHDVEVWGKPAQLTRVAAGEGVGRLLERNFARATTAQAAIDRMIAMVAECGCWRLSYARLGEGADLLRRAFENWRPESVALGEPPAPSGERPRRPKTRQRKKGKSGKALDPNAPLQRSAAAVERVVGDESFLVNDELGAIVGLDPLGGALWELLATPISIAEMAEMLGEAFPNVAAKRLQRDVEAFVTRLAKYDLVRKATAEGAAEDEDPVS